MFYSFGNGSSYSIAPPACAQRYANHFIWLHLLWWSTGVFGLDFVCVGVCVYVDI